MISYALKELKLKKYVLLQIGFFGFFILIYSILDWLNYREAIIKPSNLWIITNIFINVIIAIASTLLMSLSTVMVELKTKGDFSNLGFISIVFGIFTYGCTSCVVTFLAAVGISFSPTIFPFIGVWYGIIYKLLSLLLIGLGLLLVFRNIKKGTCKVKIK